MVGLAEFLDSLEIKGRGGVILLIFHLILLIFCLILYLIFLLFSTQKVK